MTTDLHAHPGDRKSVALVSPLVTNLRFVMAGGPKLCFGWRGVRGSGARRLDDTFVSRPTIPPSRETEFRPKRNLSVRLPFDALIGSGARVCLALALPSFLVGEQCRSSGCLRTSPAANSLRPCSPSSLQAAKRGWRALQLARVCPFHQVWHLLSPVSGAPLNAPRLSPTALCPPCRIRQPREHNHLGTADTPL